MMLNRFNFYKKISVAMIAVLTAGSVACTDNFDEINTIKGQLTLDKVDINMLGYTFAQSQYWGMRAWYQGNNLFAGEYSQFYSIIHANFPSANFEEPGSWSNLLFNGFYANTGFGAGANQLDFAEKFTAKNSMPVENAIVKLWKVQLYHRQTDYWGPMIYSKFGNGETSVPYDSQKDIYMDFFKLLDEASVVLAANRNAKPFGTNDLVYSGDVPKYLKFLNSLRLRLALRISYIDPARAKIEAEKSISGPEGVIINNADNAMLKSTLNNLNKLSTITYISEFVMSATMASIMNGYEDPRIPVYTQPCCGRLQQVKVGGLVGFRNGVPVAQRGTNLDTRYSYAGIKWLPIANGGTNEPDALIEAAEVFFLRAEGALRGWNMGGTAEQLYNSGIRASLQFRAGSSDAVINAYIASTKTPVAPKLSNGSPDAYNSPPVTDIPVKFETTGTFERRQEQIITQKWLALFPINDVEAWAERRRTGYPRGYAVIISQNPRVPKNALMRRLRYPPLAYSTNNAATTAAATLLGGPDENDTRLWWDAKPLASYPVPTN
jgi:hypothetical protein